MRWPARAKKIDRRHGYSPSRETTLCQMIELRRRKDPRLRNHPAPSNWPMFELWATTAPPTSSVHPIVGKLVSESIDVIQSDPDLIALVSEEYTDMLIATRGGEPSAPVVRAVLVELPAARMDPGFEALVEKPTYNVLMLTAARMPALEILPGIPESVPIEAPNAPTETLTDPE